MEPVRGVVVYAYGLTEEECNQLKQRASLTVPEPHIVRIDQLSEARSQVALIVRGHTSGNTEAVTTFTVWSEQMLDSEQAPEPLLLYSTDAAADAPLWEFYDGLLTDDDIAPLIAYLARPDQFEAVRLAEQMPLGRLQGLQLTWEGEECVGITFGEADLTHFSSEVRARLEQDTVLRLAFETALLDRLDDGQQWDSVRQQTVVSANPSLAMMEAMHTWLISLAYYLQDMAQTGNLVPLMATAAENSAWHAMEALREASGEDEFSLWQVPLGFHFSGPMKRENVEMQLTEEGLRILNVLDSAGQQLLHFIVEVLRTDAVDRALQRTIVWQATTESGEIMVPAHALATARDIRADVLVIRPVEIM